MWIAIYHTYVNIKCVGNVFSTSTFFRSVQIAWPALFCSCFQLIAQLWIPMKRGMEMRWLLTLLNRVVPCFRYHFWIFCFCFVKLLIIKNLNYDGHNKNKNYFCTCSILIHNPIKQRGCIWFICCLWSLIL